ncbi:hypothetical protein J3Q64DRAFT_1639384 [Phycomyces blakesleeanus]|uniref:AMP-dependent synthetase/ligase domain-containing protein n=1 Tax=Phycomyces blakesleeanus TaxID=4837 RepID=A0ABR3AZD1_PHYBL
MASNFKAIEPAPQVTLSFEDPFERWKLAELSGRQLFPIESPLNLPTDPLISLIEIIRQRSNTDIGNLVAFVSVDMKGKEVGDITWSKLDKRATDIASQLQSVGNVGDCVGLVYRRVEILEFIVAFIGCFYAGRIAVPINATESLSELAFVLQLTKAERVLTTDQNAKAFLKDIQTSQTPFPKVVWQRTDEAAGWSGRQKQTTPTDLPKDAYIEYAKAANGELKGVTVSHNTVLDQCKILDAALGYKERTCVVSFWEPRQQIGLISSIFWSVYGGHHMIFADQNILESPPVWIHVLSRYKAALAMTDYRSLLDITYFYSAYPKQVEQYNKRVKPDLSSLSCILVDTVVVRPGWHDQITEQLLRPLAADNNITAIICPVASLPEHGGIILSIRETQTAPRQYSKTDTEEENKEEKIEVQEYLLETESLWNNKVVVLAAGVQARQSASISTHYTAYVGSFGYVVPKATVAIVDPDTTLLCPGDTLGEIWIHGPALPDGFFALPRHTEAIFNAKPLAVSSETLVPELYQQTFLRTGLVGALIDGQLVILGTYEDRVRQQRRNDRLGVDRIYFSSRLVDTISQNTPVEQCVVFEILVHGQHMPVVAFESPSIPSDLPQLAESVHSALINYDSLRPFAIVILAPDALPRHRKHGRRQIHALMTKRLFLSGTMTIRYIKLDIDRTLLPLLTSDETNQEAWFKDLVHQRTIQTGVAPATVYQHTGVPPPTTIIDERSRQDLSSFRSIVDCLIWRARRTPDEITYVAVQGSTSKSYSFRKMSAKIAMVANYLTKQGLRRGQKAIVMVSFGHAWVRTIYACFSIGVIPVPIAPPDPHHYPQRVQQDVKALVDALRILHTNILIVNPPSEDAIKHPSVAAALKSSTMVAGGPPKIERINIQKASKYNTPLGTENGFFVRPEWVNSDRKTPAIILPHRTAEGKLRLMSLSHSTLLHQCSILKTVCRMKAQKNIVVTGMKIGGPNLLQAAFCGIYSGSITVLISLPDFYSSPAHFLELLNRYKVKDVIVSQELIQYVMQRATNHTQKIPLSSIENLLVTSDERPKSTLYQQMTRFFTRNQLQRNSIQTSYSHLGNSMIASTSYDLAHPTPPLIIDIEKLRQGVVRCVLPEEGSIGIEVYTSGTVSINTTVAIVHPTYRTLCPGNHLGEIWVSSDANILSEWGLSEQDHATRFEATLIGGPDPAVKYMRTGDIGFLWSWPNSTFPGRDGDQWLYVLGSMEDTIERHGLIHFCVDLERTIQQSHPDIPEESSIVFQDSEDIVAVIAVKFKPHALAAVPLVVNAVLESHTLLIDIVVVVDITQLPRERHGEKQRQKAKIAYTTKRLLVFLSFIFLFIFIKILMNYCVSKFPCMCL